MTESTTIKRSSTAVLLGIFAAFALAGTACFVFQTMQGLHVANLGNDVTWGLYIVGFLLFTGVAAGCLLFASAPFVFSGLEAYRPYARVASFVAVACGCLCAGLFILVDTGNPLRAFSILTSFQIMSPLFWDTVILIAYVALGCAFTVALVKAAEGKLAESSVRPLAIAVFVAALLVTVTSLAFALQVARPTWNNPGLMLSFFIAAVVAGGSVLVIVYAMLDRSGYLPMSAKVARGFSRRRPVPCRRARLLADRGVQRPVHRRGRRGRRCRLVDKRTGSTLLLDAGSMRRSRHRAASAKVAASARRGSRPGLCIHLPGEVQHAASAAAQPADRLRGPRCRAGSPGGRVLPRNDRVGRGARHHRHRTARPHVGHLQAQTGKVVAPPGCGCPPRARQPAPQPTPPRAGRPSPHPPPALPPFPFVRAKEHPR